MRRKGPTSGSGSGVERPPTARCSRTGVGARILVLVALGAALLDASASRASDVVNFESDPVRPLALSHSGHRLYAVNTPDARLEIFDVSHHRVRALYSVPVGLEPVAVAAHPWRPEVWVVNHLSDSISVVDVSLNPPRVVRTLQVGDEPRDVVFAGRGRLRAFVTTAHRGQNAPDPRGGYATPGIGRADVWVFDVREPDAPLTVLTLFGDRPRPLATSPDGRTVYAGIFRSGNRTAVVKSFFICGADFHTPPCTLWGNDYPGGLPAPSENFQGVPTRGGGLIVQYDEASGQWQDELGRDWSNGIPFDLPDLDVFAIDATAPVPEQRRAWSGVGTILYAIAVNPVTGTLYVANTEARNEVRFEGPGLYAAQWKPPGEPATVQGRLHQARITVIHGDSVAPRHLNKHIDYALRPAPPGVKERSLSIPTALAVSRDGRTLYVAALGSAKIGVFDTRELETDRFVPSAEDQIPLRGGGPVGIVLDERRRRLFVLTRFDNTVRAIDLDRRVELASVAMWSPEPPAITEGRRLLYDASHTSSNGEASCGVCHVFGDMDDLAWDLGDPDGEMKPHDGPKLFKSVFTEKAFHPMKGPMTTQSMRGIEGHGPLHWRGDRTGLLADPPASSLDVEAAFKQFNVAFEGLLGRTGPLSEDEMQAFADFALRIAYPPNPIRRLDDTLRPDEQRGHDIFFYRDDVRGPVRCNDCHRIDPEAGLFGTLGIHDGLVTVKIPHLRNLYQKVGMFGMPEIPYNKGPQFGYTGDQVRGFGFAHDGSEDRVQRQIAGLSFALSEEQERLDVEAFLMVAPSNLAPVVGQQITLRGAPSAAERARVALLQDRAAAPHPWPGRFDARQCELVAHAVVDGVARGWLYDPGDAQSAPGFLPDRSDEAVWSVEALLALAQGEGEGRCATRPRGPSHGRGAWARLLAAWRGHEAVHPRACRAPAAVTLTCAPPGTGHRMALDRDRDGVLDGDE